MPRQRRHGTILIRAHLLPTAPKSQQNYSSSGHSTSQFAQLPTNSRSPLKMDGMLAKVTPERWGFSKSSEPLQTRFSQGSPKNCITLLSSESWLIKKNQSIINVIWGTEKKITYTSICFEIHTQQESGSHIGFPMKDKYRRNYILKMWIFILFQSPTLCFNLLHLTLSLPLAVPIAKATL